VSPPRAPAADALSLVVARAEVNTKDNEYGCALPPSDRPAALVGAPTVTDCALRRPGRDTALHCAAENGFTESAVPLLVGGADRTVTNNDG
jgi:hypothetical protein